MLLEKTGATREKKKMNSAQFNAFFQQMMQSYQQSSNPNPQFTPNPNSQPLSIPVTQSFEPPNYENLESQVPEFSTQVGLENINLATEDSTPSGSSSKKKKKQSKKKQEEKNTREGWSPRDDLHLIAAWLGNLKDSIKGDSKKSTTYWDKLAEDYNKTRGTGNDRLAGSCKNRWSKINKTVHLWSSCYGEASRTKRSGEVDHDVMDRARDLFRDDGGGVFTMERAWVRLRDELKWNEFIQSGEKRTKFDDSGAYSSSSNAETPNSEYNSATPSQSRPMGRNAAREREKERRKGSCSGQKNQDNAEKLKVLEELEVAQRQAATALELAAKAKFEEVQVREMEILIKDTSTMTPEQRAFHEIYCAQRKQKYGIM